MMATNVQGGKLNVVHCRIANSDLDLSAAPFAGNTNRVFKVLADGSGWVSYRPGRSINNFSVAKDYKSSAAARAGTMLLIDASADFDISGDPVSGGALPVSTGDTPGAGELDPTVLADAVTPYVMTMDLPIDRVPNFGLQTGTRNTSTGAGNWTDPSKWDQGHVPAAGEIVWVKHALTYDSNVTTKIGVVMVANGAGLTFRTDINTQLWCQTLLVRETGTLTVGSVATPVANGVTAKIVFTNTAIDTSFDPNQWGNGLVGLGTVVMHGFDRGTRYLRVSAETSAGATAIPLVSAATNWQVGDRLGLPGTGQVGVASGSGSDYGAQTEVSTISSFASGNTVLNVPAITNARPGPRDWSGTLQTDILWHVVNLTSNVILTSEDVTGTPGHCMFTDRADLYLNGVLFQKLGRTVSASLDNTTWSGNTVTHVGTNQVGKYPFHMHHLGGRTTPVGGGGYQWQVVNCVVDGGDDTTHTRKWAYTIHNTSFGLLQNCVCYNVFGGGVVCEDGSETENVIQNNMMLLVHGSGNREDNDNATTGFARNGGGYWCRTGLSRYRNNVAANVGGYGFILNAIIPDLGVLCNIPTYKGAYMASMGTVGCNNNSLGNREFDGLECYGSRNGMTFWTWNTSGAYPYYLAPTIYTKNITAWHCGVIGVYAYQTCHMTMQYVRLYNVAAAIDARLNTAFTHDADYTAQSFRLLNADIHNWFTGIQVSPAAVDNYLIQDCQSHCVVSCEYSSYSTSGSDGSQAMENVVTARNCDFTVTTATSSGTKYEVWIHVGGRGGPGNNVVPSEYYVYRRNGDANQNFRLYFTESAAGAALPQSAGGTYSCPEAGLTNAQAHQKYVPWVAQVYNTGTPAPYTGLTIPVKNDNPNPNTPGLCMAGDLAPVTATTPSWTNGLVSPVGLVPGVVNSVPFVSAGWSFDEVSGTRAGYVGPSLSELGGTVTGSAGHLGNAATLVLSSSRAFSAADTAALRQPSTIAVWVKLTSKANSAWIVVKYNNSANDREYYVSYDSVSDMFVCAAAGAGDGSVLGTISADGIGSPTVGVWYLLIFKIDLAYSLLRLKVNNITCTPVAYSGGVRAGTSTFYVGSLNATAFTDAVIDETIIWKGYVTTDADDTQLWNAGAGIVEPNWSSAPVVPGIAVTTPVQAQSYQRDGSNHADIAISGTYSGSPAAIEASFNGGSYVTITASPSGGVYSGTLTSQSTGQGILTVRFTNDHAQFTTVNLVTIGDVYLVIGDSVANNPGNNLQTAAGAVTNFRRVTSSWKGGSDPTGAATAPATGSFWPLLGTTLAVNKSAPAAFVTCALGGTDMFSPNTQWLPSGGTSWAAMVSAVTASGVNAIKAVLFHCGINSLQGHPSQAQYQTAIAAVAAGCATLPGVPPLYIGLFATPTALNPLQADLDNERNAIQAKWADLTIKQGPDFQGIPNDDGIHPQTNAHLAAYAAAWAAVL